MVRELYADFNSIVRKGQVIARLDPQLIQTQVEQQSGQRPPRGGRSRAVEGRARRLASEARSGAAAEAQGSDPRTDLETAQIDVQSAEAQLKSAQAAVVQARAQLNNQQVVSLGYTTITAPIDGIVISRNVDAGQTVAASMNAPTSSCWPLTSRRWRSSLRSTSRTWAGCGRDSP